MAIAIPSVYNVGVGSPIGPFMPASTAEKVKKETWEDWLPANVTIPDDRLITREDLIAALPIRGVTVTPKDLANWQGAGVIPYGVLRWHEATRKTRTLYPSLMIDVLLQLRQLQQEGHTLQAIGPRLRSFFFHKAIWDAPAGQDEAQLGIETPVSEILTLKRPLTEIAKIHTEQTGHRVTRVDARLDLDHAGDDNNRVSGLVVDVTDESGALFTYRWP